MIELKKKPLKYKVTQQGRSEYKKLSKLLVAKFFYSES